MVDAISTATLDDGGTSGTSPWDTPALANDGNSSTFTELHSGVFGPATILLRADCGAAVTIAAMDLYGETTATTSPAVGYFTIESSTDNASWTNVPLTESAIVAGASVHYAFTADVTARYWRVKGTYGSFAFQTGRRIARWIATEGTPVPPEPEEPIEPYVPPGPGRFLLEIYVSNADAYRWGVATWGDGTWAAAGWQNVTPQGVVALLTWGVGDPDNGFLSRADPGPWQVTTWDPDRTLDPANDAGPWWPQIAPGLPIRVNHATFTVRTGIVESVGFDYATRTGTIRATDAQTLLARATVPESTIAILPDDVIARDRAAIAAAGLDVVTRYGAHSPTIAPMPDGTYTVWDVVTAAARQVLWLPYIDRGGGLNHFSWRSAEDRGAVVPSSQLIDLQSLISDDGLVSVVQVYDSDDPLVLIERRVTPTPRYGRAVVTVSDPIFHADEWAEAVLIDRSAAALRWVPGDLYLATFDAVQLAVSRQLGEVIGITYPEADPGLELRVRIVGVRLRVEHRGIRNAPTWEVSYQTVTTANEPLVTDGGAAPDWIVSDDDETIPLYPDGSVELV